MGVWKQLRLGRHALWVLPALALLVFAFSHAGRVAQAQGDAEMAISISGPGVSCSGGECDVPEGGDFTLAVDVVTPPEPGYILVQAFVDYGPDITYQPTDVVVDEFVWPDLGGDEIAVRGQQGPGLVNHGGLTGIIPPLPNSTYVGTVFQLQMQCSEEYSQTEVKLLPNGDPVALTNGAMLSYVEGTFQRQITPSVNSITVNCGEAPTPTPTETEVPEPTALPPSGTAGYDSDGALGARVWAIIGVLLAAGVAGLGLFGWRAARRQVQ
jgi:hypothetical protein